jgi:hypothetical protein
MNDALASTARRALAEALHPSSPDPQRLLSSPEVTRTALAEARWGGVEALLAHQLDELGQLPALPDTARSTLRRAVLDAQGAAHTIREAATRLARTLAQADVRFIFLKGAALAHTLYEAPWLRPMCDVDVLIDPKRFDASLKALSIAGFRLPSDRVLAFTREVSKCVPVAPPDGLEVELELHWSVVQEQRQRVDVAALFERAQPFELAGTPAWALGPVDLLLHQTVHHSYHVFEPKLIWLMDLALLHRQAPPADALIAEARRWGMSTSLALSVRHVEKVFPGVVQPDLVSFARRRRRAGVLARLGADADPITLLRGWKSPKTQLFWKLLTLDGPRQMAAQLAAWASRARRHGARPGEIVTID